MVEFTDNHKLPVKEESSECKKYQKLLKEEEKEIIVGIGHAPRKTPKFTEICRFHHTCCDWHIKTRANGNCIGCDTSQLAFSGIIRKGGLVYLLYSESKNLIKIGFTGDKKKNPLKRAESLNAEKYGEADDWTPKFYFLSLKAFKLEFKVAKLLTGKIKNLFRKKDGKQQECDEIYSCSLQDGLEAMQKVAEENNLTVETMTN
jgi:hypothetical protein